MLHSYVKVFIHLVWSTKNREPFLRKDVHPVVVQHILDYSKIQKIFINAINIQKDHIHVLITMRSDQNIDEVAKLLKGESSHWINSENLIRPKFSWQRGYGAFSLSPSHIEAVKNYISSQNEHHRKITYREEVLELLKKYGYDKVEIDKENHT